MNIIQAVPPKVSADTDVAIDTEFFGMDAARLHRPHGSFASMQICTGEDVYIILDEKDIVKSIKNVWGARTVIFQNASFDIRQLRMFVELEERPIWDTMVMERVLWGGYFEGASLADLARRYLDIHMDKDTRMEFSTSYFLTQDMLDYAAKDAYITLQVMKKQEEEALFRQADDLKVYWDIESPAIWTFLDFLPVKVDAKRWLVMVEKFTQRGEELQAELGFNVLSGKQIAKRFNSVKFPMTSKGNPSTGEAELEGMRGVIDSEIIDKILLTRHYRKASSTYGTKWIQNFVEEDGLVYSDFHVIGTETGRPSCVSGNTLLDTTRGKIRIQDLNLTSGDECSIITHTGDSKKIHNRFYQGKQMTYGVKISSGNYIEATLDHRFLTPDGWKRLHELQTGDKICANLYNAGKADRWTQKNFVRREFCEASVRRKPIIIRNEGDIWDLRGNNFFKTNCWSSFLLSRYKKTSQGSYLLGSKCVRASFIKSVAGYGDSTCASVLLRSRELLETGRFSFQAKESDCRNKWVNTQRQINRGLQKISANEEFGVSSKNFFWKRDGKDSYGNSVVVIESIEPVGIQDVWDIEVEDEHSYVANGFINHNCSNPNLLNIPSNKIPEYRDLFISAKGKLIVADISAQEPRCLAYLSRDKNLIDMFQKGLDVHLEVARVIYDDPTLTKRKDKKKRDVGKTINLATSYGLTAKGLATRLNISLEDAERFMRNYFRKFPGVQLYITRQRQLARRLGYIETIYGRRVWMNRHNFQIENNAINAPIQGSSADFSKYWMNLFRTYCKQSKLEFPVCNMVYDELVCDVKESLMEAYKDLLLKSFHETAEKLFPGIPFELEIGVGDKWSCK